MLPNMKAMVPYHLLSPFPAKRQQSKTLLGKLGPYLYLMKRLEYRKIKGQELLLNVAGPKRSFCARNLRSKMDLN